MIAIGLLSLPNEFTRALRVFGWLAVFTLAEVAVLAARFNPSTQIGFAA